MAAVGGSASDSSALMCPHHHSACEHGQDLVGAEVRTPFAYRVVAHGSGGQGVPTIRAATGRKVIAMGDLEGKKTSELAEVIADTFYGDGFDLSTRENAVAGTWSEMPEVRVVPTLPEGAVLHQGQPTTQHRQ